MDSFDVHSKRPEEASSEDAYFNKYNRLNVAVATPTGTPVHILNVESVQHHAKNGNVREKFTVACLLPGKENFVNIQLWGAGVNKDGAALGMGSSCWDFCFLAETMKPGCFKEKRTYSGKYDGMEHTVYTAFAGLKMYLVYVDLGQSNQGNYFYNGLFFDFQSRLSAKEMQSGVTTPADVTTSAVERLTKDREEALKKKQGGNSYGGGQSYGSQQGSYGQQAQGTYGQAAPAQAYGQATPAAAPAPAAPAAAPAVEPDPFGDDAIPF